jgi:hypothetical protein
MLAILSWKEVFSEDRFSSVFHGDFILQVMYLLTEKLHSGVLYHTPDFIPQVMYLPADKPLW